MVRCIRMYTICTSSCDLRTSLSCSSIKGYFFISYHFLWKFMKGYVMNWNLSQSIIVAFFLAVKTFLVFSFGNNVDYLRKFSFPKKASRILTQNVWRNATLCRNIVTRFIGSAIERVFQRNIQLIGTTKSLEHAERSLIEFVLP